MERNLPGDAAKAKQLLQNIVSNDLEGKEFAQEWLRKLMKLHVISCTLRIIKPESKSHIFKRWK